MVFLAGAAATTAMDLISSLTQTLDSATKSKKAKTSPFEIKSANGLNTNSLTSPVSSSAASGSAQAISPTTMNALLNVQSGDQTQSTSAVKTPDASGLATRMMSFLDKDGDGAISSSEMQTALGGNGNSERAKALFGKIDANADGSVSKDELQAALKSYGQRNHAPPMTAANGILTSSAVTASNASTSTTSVTA